MPWFSATHTPALLPQWWLRTASAVVPHCFCTASALLPQWFRTASSLLPQWFRTSSAVDLHFFRSGSALLPQWFRSGSSLLPQWFLTADPPLPGSRSASFPGCWSGFRQASSMRGGFETTTCRAPSLASFIFLLLGPPAGLRLLLRWSASSASAATSRGARRRVAPRRVRDGRAASGCAARPRRRACSRDNFGSFGSGCFHLGFRVRGCR